MDPLTLVTREPVPPKASTVTPRLMLPTDPPVPEWAEHQYEVAGR